MTMKKAILALLAGPALIATHAYAAPQKAVKPAVTSAGLLKAAQNRIPAFLSCLKDQKVSMLGAHRGGPLPEFPENALATLERTTSMIPVFLEVDVQQSFDDQLFLNHDPVLHRNTVGHGNVREMRWDQISKLKLRDQSGQPTEYTAPLLSDTLKWAENRALLLLDVKPSTDQDLLVEIVKEAKAEGRTMFLSYTIKQALGLRKLLPDAVIALPVFDRNAMEEAKAAGLLNSHLLAMLRPDRVDANFIPELEKLGVTILSASYGGKNTPDAGYYSLADAGLYHDLAAKGPRLIASNRPHEAAAAMLAQPEYVAKLRRCGVTS